MSGALKAGLIFGVIGLIVVLAVAFIPAVGPIICGPLVAVIIGAVAGFYGVRWSAGTPGISRGVLAGTLAGVGMLLGAVIAYTILVGMARSNPMFQEQIQEALRRQPNAQIDPAALNTIVGIMGPAVGFCFGILNLLIALAFGALGGWLAIRNRPPALPPVEPLG
ncbi:MAG: hypothetical protein ABIV47_12615 [Roseiflexaceae bacterium]